MFQMISKRQAVTAVACIGASAACVAGCSSSEPAEDPGRAVVSAEMIYVATAPGPYAWIALEDAKHYMLLKRDCSAPARCIEEGTYAVDGGKLTLTDSASGAAITLDVAKASTTQSSPKSLRPLAGEQPAEGQPPASGQPPADGTNLVTPGTELIATPVRIGTQATQPSRIRVRAGENMRVMLQGQVAPASGFSCPSIPNLTPDQAETQACTLSPLADAVKSRVRFIINNAAATGSMRFRTVSDSTAAPIRITAIKVTGAMSAISTDLSGDFSIAPPAQGQPQNPDASGGLTIRGATVSTRLGFDFELDEQDEGPPGAVELITTTPSLSMARTYEVMAFSHLTARAGVRLSVGKILSGIGSGFGLGVANSLLSWVGDLASISFNAGYTDKKVGPICLDTANSTSVTPNDRPLFDQDFTLNVLKPICEQYAETHAGTDCSGLGAGGLKSAIEREADALRNRRIWEKTECAPVGSSSLGTVNEYRLTFRVPARWGFVAGDTAGLYVPTNDPRTWRRLAAATVSAVDACGQNDACVHVLTTRGSLQSDACGMRLGLAQQSDGRNIVDTVEAPAR